MRVWMVAALLMIPVVMLVGRDTNAEEREHIRELLAQRDDPALVAQIKKVQEDLQKQYEASEPVKKQKALQMAIDAAVKDLDSRECGKDEKVLDQNTTHVLTFLHCVKGDPGKK